MNMEMRALPVSGSEPVRVTVRIAAGSSTPEI